MGHSPLMLDAFMIGPHNSMSDFSNAASSAGEDGVTDVAMSPSRCFSGGYASEENDVLVKFPNDICGRLGGHVHSVPGRIFVSRHTGFRNRRKFGCEF